MVFRNWGELVETCAAAAQAVIDDPSVDPAVLDDMSQDMAAIGYALQIERRRRSRARR